MTSRIGLVGLGRIGMPICARLAAAGYEVTAGDRRAELEPEVVARGAGWAASSLAVAAGVDVLITVLPGQAEVREALLSPEGALAGLRAGATWIDMSSCPPGVGRELGDHARELGVRPLDAPVGRNVRAEVSPGPLQLFVGGEAELVEEHRGLLEAAAGSAEIRHVGAHSAGYATKLLVNLLWFGQAVATAEAMLVAEREGLDLDVFRQALASSSASSHFIRSDLDALLEGDYMRSFPLDRCCEELASITARADELGVPHELSSLVESIYQRALERYGAVDGELLAVSLLEEQAGTRLRHGRPQTRH